MIEKSDGHRSSGQMRHCHLSSALSGMGTSIRRASRSVRSRPGATATSPPTSAECEPKPSRGRTPKPRRRPHRRRARSAMPLLIAHLPPTISGGQTAATEKVPRRRPRRNATRYWRARVYAASSLAFSSPECKIQNVGSPFCWQEMLLLHPKGTHARCQLALWGRFAEGSDCS